MVNINNLVRETCHEFWRQHTHVFRQNHVIRLIRLNRLGHLDIVLFAGHTFMANQLERDIETLNQRAQRIVVANHRGDLDNVPLW